MSAPLQLSCKSEEPQEKSKWGNKPFLGERTHGNIQYHSASKVNMGGRTERCD